VTISNQIQENVRTAECTCLFFKQSVVYQSVGNLNTVLGQLKPGLVEGIASRPVGESHTVTPLSGFLRGSPVLGFQIKPQKESTNINPRRRRSSKKLEILKISTRRLTKKLAAVCVKKLCVCARAR